MSRHEEVLLKAVGDEAWVSAFKENDENVELSDAEWAMLTYTKKLTIDPSSVAEDDIRQLRQLGFNDTAILEINQVTGFMAWVNRTTEGLGVEL